MPREFCYGDRVWSPLFGWGTVKSIQGKVTRGGRSGEVVVSADVQPSAHWTFAPCGRQGLINGELAGQPLLFHEEMQYSPRLPSGKPPTFPDIELVKDAPVWVLIAGNHWGRRHFAQKDNAGRNGIYVWSGGRTSHTAESENGRPRAYYDFWAPFDPDAHPVTQLEQMNAAVSGEYALPTFWEFKEALDALIAKFAADAQS